MGMQNQDSSCGRVTFEMSIRHQVELEQMRQCRRAHSRCSVKGVAV